MKDADDEKYVKVFKKKTEENRTDNLTDLIYAIIYSRTEPDKKRKISNQNKYILFEE